MLHIYIKGNGVSFFVILAIKCYQKLLSPRTGFFRLGYSSPIFNLNPGVKAGCRQEPSCSEYCIQVVSKYGVVKGLAKSLLRVVQCR